jgi:hypothetical protein
MAGKKSRALLPGSPALAGQAFQRGTASAANRAGREKRGRIS